MVIEKGDDEAVTTHPHIYLAFLNKSPDVFHFALRLAMTVVDTRVAQLNESLRHHLTILLPFLLLLNFLRSDQVLKFVFWEQASWNHIIVSERLQ